MKQFNDLVTYVRDNQLLPAIVLKAQIVGNVELLTLLYADPNNGPGLISQGTTRNIAQVSNAVGPWVKGKAFGWKEGYVSEENVMKIQMNCADDMLVESGRTAQETERADALQKQLDQCIASKSPTPTVAPLK